MSRIADAILRLLRSLLLLPLRRPPSSPAIDDWPACSQWILDREGGFADDPRDSGGPTNMGITLATLRHHRGVACTIADLRGMEQTEAVEIYHTSYWHACRCDEMPRGVDLVLVDAAVMSGPAAAARMLQRVLMVPEDGIIGPQTMAAVHAVSPRTTLQALGRERGRFYRSLHSPFEEGWLSRADMTQKRALAMLDMLPA